MWNFDNPTLAKGGEGGFSEVSNRQSAFTNLTSILSSSGLSYYIPQTDEEFRETFRSGRYSTYLLVDFNREDLKDELKEAINYGDGLVYIKTIPSTISVLQEVFGVQFSGMSTYQNLTVHLTESPISGSATLQTIDKDVKTTITSPTAQSFGYVVDKNLTYPVIVYNEYGRGAVILFSFDLLNSPDQQKAGELIANAIRYVAPVMNYTKALGSEKIRITLQNFSEPAEVMITETIPSGTAADCIYPAPEQSGTSPSLCHSGLSGILPPNGNIKWQLSLGSHETRTLSYLLNLPDYSGEYQLGTELTFSNHGTYRLYGNYSLTVTVEGSSGELLLRVISDLQVLNVAGTDATHISNAIYYLSLIQDHQGLSKAEAQNNINHILNALKSLEKVSVDVSAIRLKLDELLKIWQAKWSVASNVVSEYKRYRLAYETDARRIEKVLAESPCPSFPQSSGGLPAGQAGNPGSSCMKPLLVASADNLNGLNSSNGLNEVLYFYHTDHLGTPILMTDKNQNVVWEGEFLPFGEEYSITGTITSNLRFPGQYYDEETGLHQNWYRDYKPEVGRYIEYDPLLRLIKLYKPSTCYTEDSNDPTKRNKKVSSFVYTDNNPASIVDPTGLDGCGPGSGLWELSIPDYPLGNNYTGCCNNHDNCYGCEGKNHGKTKYECDIVFCGCLVAKCLLSFPTYLPCPSLEYCLAVSLGGGSAFEDARECCP